MMLKDEPHPVTCGHWSWVFKLEISLAPGVLKENFLNLLLWPALYLLICLALLSLLETGADWYEV